MKSISHLPPETQQLLQGPDPVVDMEFLDEQSTLQNWWYLITQKDSKWIRGPILRMTRSGSLLPCEDNFERGVIDKMWGTDEAGRQYLTFHVWDARTPHLPTLIIAHEQYVTPLSPWIAEGVGYSLSPKMIVELFTKGETIASGVKIVSNCTEEFR